MKFDKTLKKNRTVLIVLTLALIVAVAGSSFSLSILNPGWEIYDQIAALKFGTGVKTGANDFPHPYTVSGPMWKVDDDPEYWGVPTIMVQTSEIRHVDFSGHVIPDSTPATTPRTVTRGNHTYVLDYHVYMFDVSLRTIADYRQVGASPFGPPIYDHETSWGTVCSDPFGDSTHRGAQFDGGAYVKFVINPWRGTATVDAPENYTIADAWSGVMNAEVFQKDGGQVENQWGQKLNPVEEAPMFSRAGLDNGAQVPMFKDDGTYGTPSPRVDWGASSPDSRIDSTAILYLPAQLEAGAYFTRHWLTGECIGITPCDVYAKYTVRVDVLTTHDFVLQTASNPGDLTPPKDFFSYVLGWWEQPQNQALVFLIAAVIVAIIVFWIYVNRRRRSL